MTVEAFPPVELADEDGILCIGGDLEVESLLLAYSSGIFPWPISKDTPLVWFSPPKRALLFLDRVKISRSLRRERAKDGYSFKIDSAFEQVMRCCAVSKNRKLGHSTWITAEMRKGYIALHRAGWCHSVECFYEGELAGGLYGVSIGGMFAGESMFYLKPNASKLALWHLIEYLRERNVGWIDCQQLTPLLRGFGAEEVERPEFIALLQTAIQRPRVF